VADDTPAPVAQPRYVVDRQTLVDAFEAHAWSSPDQMADMLIDGLDQIGVPTLDAARSVPDNAALREAVEWHLANPHNVNEGHSRLRAALAAAPASPAGLDVERLAGLMHAMAINCRAHLDRGHDLGHLDDARDLAALAAAPASPAGLDVERLARAMNKVRPYGGNPSEWAKVAAAAIAREYAAIASPEETSPDA